jgi:hypothetical protein
MVWPLTATRFRALMGAAAAAAEDVAALDGAIAAAVAYVEEHRADLFNDADPPVFVETPTIELGTAMLANRWYQRRSSPLGPATYSEFGGSPLLRHDPDIAKLLGIGGEGRFVFGAAGYKPSTDTVT